MSLFDPSEQQSTKGRLGRQEPSVVIIIGVFHFPHIQELLEILSLILASIIYSMIYSTVGIL